MRPCICCGQPTEGSVGAAGIHWPMLCQPCKNVEDAALAAQVQATIRTVNLTNQILGRMPVLQRVL